MQYDLNDAFLSLEKAPMRVGLFVGPGGNAPKTSQQKGTSFTQHTQHTQPQHKPFRSKSIDLAKKKTYTRQKEQDIHLNAHTRQPRQTNHSGSDAKISSQHTILPPGTSKLYTSWPKKNTQASSHRSSANQRVANSGLWKFMENSVCDVVVVDFAEAHTQHITPSVNLAATHTNGQVPSWDFNKSVESLDNPNKITDPLSHKIMQELVNGELCIKQDEFDLAAGHFQRVLELDNKHALAYYKMAYVWAHGISQGNRESAIERAIDFLCRAILFGFRGLDMIRHDFKSIMQSKLAFQVIIKCLEDIQMCKNQISRMKNEEIDLQKRLSEAKVDSKKFFIANHQYYDFLEY